MAGTGRCRLGRRTEHWPQTARRQGDEETGKFDSMQGA